MLRNNIILKHNLVSTSAFIILLTKKVRVDNNDNYAKNTHHVKPVSEVSNVTLQIIV